MRVPPPPESDAAQSGGFAVSPRSLRPLAGSTGRIGARALVLASSRVSGCGSRLRRDDCPPPPPRSPPLTSRLPSSQPRSIAGVEDADELETVDDGSGQAVAGAGEDVSERKALWNQLRSMIGADIMSLLSVPVFIMEPTTMLQKMSDILQYVDLIEKACDEKDEDLRLAYISALAVSTYSSSERVKKPFNPILGETFEMTLPGGGLYVSEQVCHHPPIGAGHAETDRWTYDLTSAVRTKFMGNWVDVWPQGRTRIKLKSSGDVYNICPPPSRVNNVLVGRTWIDHFGDMQVNNLTTGLAATDTRQPEHREPRRPVPPAVRRRPPHLAGRGPRRLRRRHD